jgi:hypothetical protein
MLDTLKYRNFFVYQSTAQLRCVDGTELRLNALRTSVRRENEVNGHLKVPAGLQPHEEAPVSSEGHRRLCELQSSLCMLGDDRNVAALAGN